MNFTNILIGLTILGLFIVLGFYISYESQKISSTPGSISCWSNGTKILEEKLVYRVRMRTNMWGSAVSFLYRTCPECEDIQVKAQCVIKKFKRTREE